MEMLHEQDKILDIKSPHTADGRDSDDSAFANRRILVTGASRGIAADITAELVKAGAHVALHYSKVIDDQAGFPETAQNLSKNLSAHPGKVTIIDQDMQDSGAGSRLAETALEQLGPIDSLILSASVQIERPFLEQTEADIDQQYTINLKQNLMLIQRILPCMLGAGFGRVLSIGSIQERVPNKRMPMYSVTKAAQRAMIEGLALEYAQSGVTFNTLSPGLIETDRNARFRSDHALWSSIQKRANPMGRAGHVSEVTPTALHLLSKQSSYITGATVSVSGGAHLPSAENWG